MRYLKSYKIFEESNSYEEMKNIIEDVNNICDDIRDNDFTVTIKPNDDISIKMLGMYKKGTISLAHTTELKLL